MTTCDSRRIAASLACAAALSMVAPAAWAQAEEQAAARALFEEGRKLMKANDYASACPKLEAARKLYTSAGILLNLADCHEKIGRTASAWTEFGEAATVAARTRRDDDAEEARRRQAALEPSLARMVIRVARSVPGLTVKKDGATLASAAWGAALPVDPGPHKVQAEAAGFDSWTTSITISKPGQVVTVDVPQLRATPVATQPAQPAKPMKLASEPGRAPDTTAPRSGRTLPWVLLGAGAAVALGGGVLMLVESRRAASARDNHDPAAYDATRTPWTIGVVGAIAGVATAAVGTALLAIGPGETGTSPAAVSAWIGAGSGGVLLARSW